MFTSGASWTDLANSIRRQVYIGVAPTLIHAEADPPIRRTHRPQPDHPCRLGPNSFRGCSLSESLRTTLTNDWA